MSAQLPDPASPIALALADHELDAFLSLESVFGFPQNNDADREYEPAGDGNLRATDRYRHYNTKETND